jgi:primosomal protein N'
MTIQRVANIERAQMLVESASRVALQRFLDHVAKHDKVWVCRRVDIARHWQATHPFKAA